jgi:hypothetical protein
MISPDEAIVSSDFISESEKDATPANDEGRVPKLESDGKLSEVWFNPFSTTLLGITIDRFAKVSDNQIAINSSEQTTTATSYTKLKETKVNENASRLRVIFSARCGLQAGTGDYKNVAVFLNGVQVSEDFNPSHSNTVYSTHSYDFTSGVSTNDLIQIYGKKLGTSYTAIYVKDVKICYTSEIEEIGALELHTPLDINDPNPLSTTNVL